MSYGQQGAGFQNPAIITANEVIIVGSKDALLVYSGAPAKGTLIAAIAAQNGTDKYGNNYPALANFGVWDAVTGNLDQHFGINASGDIYLANMAGKTIVHGRTTDGALFFYNTSGEGSGNLIDSIAPVATTDAAGNTVQAGIVSYSGGNSYAALFGAFLSLFTGGDSTPAQVSHANAGQLFLSSGYTSGTDQDAEIDLVSKQSAGAGGIATVSVSGLLKALFGMAVTGGATITGGLNIPNTSSPHFGVDSNGTLYLSGDSAGADYTLIDAMSNPSGMPLVTAPAGGANQGLAGYWALGEAADFTSYTVTSNTGFVQASKAWSIPANDAQAGTTYRLTVTGNGTLGATARQIEFETSGGFAKLIATVGANSASFSFKVVIEITVITTGAGGTANVSLTFTAADTTNNTVTGGTSFSHAIAFNTTSAFTLELAGQWANTGQTFTSYQSILERIGP